MNEHFKTARFIATQFFIIRYLMSNTEGSLDGAEKAARHHDLCSYYAAVFLDHYDPETVRRCNEYGEVLYQAIHKATQSLTDHLDVQIGFPIKGRPNYEILVPKFFEQFDKLVLQVIDSTKFINND